MTAPMTPERLAEIQAASTEYHRTWLIRHRPNSAIAHRRELLAEVERLTRERDQALNLMDVFDGIVAGIRDPYGHGPLADSVADAVARVRRALTEAAGGTQTDDGP